MTTLPKPGTPFRKRPLWYLVLILGFERMNDFLRTDAVPEDDYEDMKELYPRAKAFCALWEMRNQNAGFEVKEQSEED